jgi:excinuclease UvrABC ATPase subunit
LQLSDGSEIVAVGTPEDVAKVAKNCTEQYLKGVLRRPRKEAAE